MNQPAPSARSGPDMRDLMPLTAAQINDWRLRFGAAHVNDCIRRGIRGERNAFYAVEAGHFLGTPFNWGERMVYAVSMSILSGAPFVAGIMDPDGVADMKIKLAAEQTTQQVAGQAAP